MRVLGVIGLTLALATSAVPAQATEPDSTVVTITGHVIDRDGEPIAGIEVTAGCPCDGYSTVPHASGSDVTDSTGFYSFKVVRSWVDFTYFTDPNDNYFVAATKDATTTISGTTYTRDVTLERTSRITGTVTAVNGGRAHGTIVKFYDPKTGRGRGQTSADKDGHFEIVLKHGHYRVQFGGGYYANKQWYGGVATEAESPVVSVGYGKTTKGIDETVTPKPTVRGSITIDGKSMLGSVKERLVLTVTDETGAQLGYKYLPSTAFSLVELHPGALTLNFRATKGSGDWIEPYTQKIYLAPGTAIDGLSINLTSNPATLDSTRSTSVHFKESTKGIAKAGKRLAGKIILRSYGDVTGGRISIYVDGKKVDTRAVPASGRVNWSYTPKKVVFGKFNVKVKYFGTETTRSNSTVVYALYGA